MEGEQSRGLTRRNGSIACCHIRPHTALVMVLRGDLRDEREMVFWEKPLFFSLHLLRHGLYGTQRAKEKYTGDRLMHQPYGRTLPETEWRDLSWLTTREFGISASVSLSRSPSSLSPSLYRILPSSIFHHPPPFHPLLLSFSPRPDSLSPSLPLPPLPHHPSAMDNSHDYSTPHNSCIPNVVPPGVDPSLVDFREFYPYIPNEIKHRKRTTPAQLEILEQTFARDKKPNGVMRANLARQLDMTPRGVQVSLRTPAPPDLPPSILTCVYFRQSPGLVPEQVCPHFIFPYPRSIPHPFHAGGRKRKRWQKRLLPNSSIHNHHSLVPQIPKRAPVRTTRSRCNAALPPPPTASISPFPLLSLLRPLTVSTRPKTPGPLRHPSPPLDTT